MRDCLVLRGVVIVRCIQCAHLRLRERRCCVKVQRELRVVSSSREMRSVALWCRMLHTLLRVVGVGFACIVVECVKCACALVDAHRVVFAVLHLAPVCEHVECCAL